MHLTITIQLSVAQTFWSPCTKYRARYCLQDLCNVLECDLILTIHKEFQFVSHLSNVTLGRRTVTARAPVQSQASVCGICGTPNGIGTGLFPRMSVVPCQYHSTNNSFSYHWHYRGADKSLARPDCKNNWKVAIFPPTWRSLLPRRPCWTDNRLNFSSGLQKLEFGRCSFFPSWSG